MALLKASPHEAPLTPVPLEEVESSSDFDDSDKTKEEINKDELIDQALDEY